MRGGTSKGTFFLAEDLPEIVRSDPAARDRFFQRVVGSPDAYGKQIDGMGGATSSTSKIVVIARSQRPNCDVDYTFGQVPINGDHVDWSGNCGNLTGAVGPFAIHRGLIDVQSDGLSVVRIWQTNLRKLIVARVPVEAGEVVELGQFRLDGVTFPAAEVQLDFVDPGSGSDDGAASLFPTGNVVDELDVPGIGRMDATYISAGNPTIFVDASSLGLLGTELQADVNGDVALLSRLEAIRAHGAVAMGIAPNVHAASARHQHVPKLAFVATPQDYTASNGSRVLWTDVQLLARILSMGVLHHAMTGTGAVALAAALSVPGTVPQRLGIKTMPVHFGHPSGKARVGAETVRTASGWHVRSVSLSRSARRLMDGHIFVPSDFT
ncbi:3-methylitaconate isomerase [Variovorax sp. PBL-H6]|nr:3-methylitaconate isomerase [Variovorax sp. PBL-H6]